MKTKNKSNPILKLASLLLVLGSTQVTKADPLDYLRGNQIEIGTVGGSASATYLSCPCFRLSIKARALGGQWNVRNFIIGSDALFQFRQSADLALGTTMSRYYQISPLEVLSRRGHVGIAFDGITLGDDLDRSYTDIFRTGVSAIINMVATDAIRLDLRTGYDFERMNINLGTQREAHVLPQTLLMRWRTRHWSGHMSGTVGFPSDSITDPDQFLYAAELDQQVRFLTRSDLQFAFDIDLGFERNPFREAYGLARDNLSAEVGFEISWLRGYGR